MLSEGGPIAAIAATRVTMPYGNTVFGCELLRAAMDRRDTTLGEVWLRAERATLAEAPKEDSLRMSLDSLARGVSPPPVELAAERREHVLLYQLLGDPLLRLNYPPAEVQAPAQVAAVAQIGAREISRFQRRQLSTKKLRDEWMRPGACMIDLAGRCLAGEDMSQVELLRRTIRT